MTTDTITFNVGDRVRLIDSEGDSSSRANVGDTGTVEIGATTSPYDILQVTMDDGHSTRRNAHRWERVEEETPLTEAQQREVWASLPIREAYPVGSQWHHRSYGDAVYEVTDHRGDRELNMRYISGGHTDSSRHESAWWVRGALDTYGTPVGLIPETVETPATDFVAGQRVEVFNWEGGESEWNGPATVESVGHYVNVRPDTGRWAGELGGFDREYLRALPDESAPVDSTTDTTVEEATVAPAEPYRPVVGERVIVTNDPDTPANNGKPAQVLEVRADRIGVADRYPFRVNYDDGSGYGSWWVREVRALLPTTEEEFNAAIARAVETATEEGKREGREAATTEAAEHMERIVESAHEYARDNQLCSQFDRFMVQNGLRPRDTYTQNYRVDVVYSVYVSARPGDADAIREAAMERVNSGYESPEFDWEEA